MPSLANNQQSLAIRIVQLPNQIIIIFLNSFKKDIRKTK